ncbi:MAG: PAS domain S-box protein [Oscillatoria sp. SIO1A7]|nr:PAS domain S-box protein [Oscillatoria sp. SIO1A7]
MTFETFGIKWNWAINGLARESASRTKKPELETPELETPELETPEVQELVKRLQLELADQEKVAIALGSKEVKTCGEENDGDPLLEWTLCPGGTLIEANKAALELGGVEAGSKGDPIWQTRWWSQEAAKQWLLWAIATAQKGRSVRGQVPLQRFDGSSAIIDLFVKAIRNGAGTVVRLQVIGRDLTEENERLQWESSDRLGAMPPLGSMGAGTAIGEKPSQEGTKGSQKSPKLNPDELNPDELNPDELNPDELNPDELNPDESFCLVQSTLESLADGVLGLSTEGTVTAFNQSLVEMWEIPERIRAVVDSKQWLEFLALQCERAEAIRLFQAIHGSTEGEKPEILRLKNGRMFDCSSRTQKLGKRIIGTVWTFRDITVCERAQSELRQSEAQFRVLAEMTDAIIYIDRKERFRYVNPAGTTITGYSSPELLENSKFQQLMEVSEDSEVVEQEENNPQHKEFRFVTKSGEDRWLDCWISKIKIEGEMAVLGIAVDVTDRKKAELAVHRALAQEKELSQWRSHLVSMLSHEFGKPLNIISFAASSLQNYGDGWKKEKKSKYLARIQSAVHQINKLLNDVLVMGCADAGKIKYDPQPLDLIRFCQEIVASIELEPTSAGHPIHFIYRQGDFARKTQGDRELEATVKNAETPIGKNIQDITEENNPRVNTPNSPKLFNLDAKLLEPILTNLLSNACKYSAPESPVFLKVAFSPEEGDDPTLEEACTTNQDAKNACATIGGQITFQIEDRGIGILWADRQKLFEPFHRGENVGDIPGYGVGLAVVKKFVRLHGGQITCSSQLDKGTTFTVTLPLNSS